MECGNRSGGLSNGFSVAGPANEEFCVEDSPLTPIRSGKGPVGVHFIIHRNGVTVSASNVDDISSRRMMPELSDTGYTKCVHVQCCDVKRNKWRDNFCYLTQSNRFHVNMNWNSTCDVMQPSSAMKLYYNLNKFII